MGVWGQSQLWVVFLLIWRINMAKQHNTILIIGDGPTEFYYFKSLCGVYRHITFKPDYPRHTNLVELEEKIEEGVSMGYRYICCIIDMDTKHNESERTRYSKLKAKYANPVDKPKRGIYCEVKFFETHRCTELFFLYYFCYTSRQYTDQDSLINDLKKYVEYEKKTCFFLRCKGLHAYFERNGGKLSDAIKNANKSLDEKLTDGRDYTYSELGQLITALNNLSK